MKQIALILAAACAACGLAEQPESARTVAAYEIPLPTTADREAFLDILREEALRSGHHADAATAEELRSLSEISALTVNVGVWRGTEDDESVASAMDGPDHPGDVWIMFSKGTEPGQVAAFREKLMRRISRRWPRTARLPITPSGGVPLREDLIRTPSGYEINPLEAEKYRREADR